MYLWDKLLPQAELTLNLLRQSNANPRVSAHAHLFGPFDFNRFPLAPLGCAVQVHIPPETRTSWGLRAKRGWYIGCAPDHYRLHTFVDNVTKQEGVSGAVTFKHKSRTNPQLSSHDKIMRAYQELHDKITGKSTRRGAEDTRQLRALVDAITPEKLEAELHQAQADIEEIRRLRLEIEALRNGAAPRVQTRQGGSAPRVPGQSEPCATPLPSLPAQLRPEARMPARAPRVASPRNTIAAHDGPASRTRSRCQ